MRLSRVSWWPFPAIAVLAIATRLYHVNSIPLWTDELFTRFYPHAGLAYLWGQGFRAEPTSPLYYTLIAGIEHGFGSRTWELRLPSVLASLGSVWIAGALGQELFGRRGVVLLAALLLALAPINVFYAQEARTYALQGAALGVAILGFARVLRGGTGLLLYVVGAILAIWLHPTSIVAIAAINAGALTASVGRERLLTPLALGRWIVANVLVLIACIPLIPGIIWPPNGGAATIWIPSLSRWWLESVIGETLAGPAMERHAKRIAEVAVLVLAGLTLIPLWRPGRRAVIVLLVVPGIALIGMIGISAIKPILLSRTMAWLLLPLAVSLGAILSQRAVVLRAMVVAVLASALFVQIERGATLKEDWRGLFAQMGDLAPALVVLGPHSPPGAVAVYGPPGTHPVRLDDGLAPVPETTMMPRLFGTPTLTQAELAAAINGGRPVWLIFRRPEVDWVKREVAGLPPPVQSLQSDPGPNPELRAWYWSR